MLITHILQEIVLPLSRGSYLFSERPSLEGVHAYLCAKEIFELLESKQLFVDIKPILEFDKHQAGVQIVASWAFINKLNFQKEVDISVGVVDIVVYADDVGLFEIGTTS